MKRILATFLATLVLAAGLPAAPAAAAVSEPGPACADINGNSGQSSYAVLSNREAVLSIAITTVAPLCRAATLTVSLHQRRGGHDDRRKRHLPRRQRLQLVRTRLHHVHPQLRENGHRRHIGRPGAPLRVPANEPQHACGRPGAERRSR